MSQQDLDTASDDSDSLAGDDDYAGNEGEHIEDANSRSRFFDQLNERRGEDSF